MNANITRAMLAGGYGFVKDPGLNDPPGPSPELRRLWLGEVAEWITGGSLSTTGTDLGRSTQL